MFEVLVVVQVVGVVLATAIPTQLTHLHEINTKSKLLYSAHIHLKMLTALGVYIQMYRGRPYPGSNMDRRRANPPL
jgi:hypothetical protein